MTLTSKHFILGVLVVIIVVGAAIASLSRGVIVEINNNSDGRIENIELRFTGNVQYLAELRPNQRHSFLINPTGESSINLSFVDKASQPHEYKIDVYIEHNYRGNVDIEIGKNNRVKWTEKIKLPLL